MINSIKYILFSGCLLITYLGASQETVNGSDVNSFIIGGGQETTPATLFVNPVSIIDVSPEGVAVIADGAAALLEAGLPVLAGGTSDFIPDIWINYTFRPELPGDESEIFMRLSQPLPAGISLRAKVIETGTGGNFEDRGENKNFELTTNNKKVVKSFEAGYTDDGVGNGYKIQFTYSNNGSNSLPPGLTVIYEIIKK